MFESESLLVQVASPEYLLAMKLHASRDERDLDDAATLFGLLGYTTAEQSIELLTSTYPAGWLLPRHRYVVQDVAERAAPAAPHRAPSRRRGTQHGSSAIPSPASGPATVGAD